MVAFITPVITYPFLYKNCFFYLFLTFCITHLTLDFLFSSIPFFFLLRSFSRSLSPSLLITSTSTLLTHHLFMSSPLISLLLHIFSSKHGPQSYPPLVSPSMRNSYHNTATILHDQYCCQFILSFGEENRKKKIENTDLRVCGFFFLCGFGIWFHLFDLKF